MIEFIKENYEWLFSGIGVTFLIWLFNWLKKATKKLMIHQDVIAKLLNKRNNVPPAYFTITKEDGTEEDVEAILAFEFKDTKREYVVYTKGETDKYGNVTVYVSHVDRSTGNAQLVDVPNEREWKRVREVLKELAESDGDQPFYDEDGIEII